MIQTVVDIWHDAKNLRKALTAHIHAKPHALFSVLFFCDAVRFLGERAELEQRALAGETAQRECAELLLTRASLDQEKLACEARRPPPAARSPPFRRLDRSIDPQRDRSCPMGGNGPSLGRPTRAV